MIQNRSTVAVVLGIVIGLVITGTLVLRTTQAVFSGTTTTTTTPTNSWATGGASITNDHTATAVFSTATDGTLTGGQTLSRCVVVTYNGATTTGVSVKLYGSSSGTLASYLTLSIDQGSGDEKPVPRAVAPASRRRAPSRAPSTAPARWPTSGRRGPPSRPGSGRGRPARSGRR